MNCLETQDEPAQDDYENALPCFYRVRDLMTCSPGRGQIHGRDTDTFTPLTLRFSASGRLKVSILLLLMPEEIPMHSWL